MEVTESTHTLRLSEIEPRRDQPRKVFNAEALSGLADSIAANGLIQPIVVREQEGNSFYQIIAGERRWRAAKMAGLTEVPVIILDADDRKVAEYALIENIQREDLNPIEEAEGYGALMKDYGLTQEEVSRKVGKSRSAVANSLRLLDLPKDVLSLVSDASLSAGHARTLLGLNDKQQIQAVAALAIKQEMTVRELEQYVKKCNSSPKKSESTEERVEREYYSSLSDKITKTLGCKVHIKNSGKNKTISIACKDADELEDLIRKLAGKDADKIFQ